MTIQSGSEERTCYFLAAVLASITSYECKYVSKSYIVGEKVPLKIDEFFSIPDKYAQEYVWPFYFSFPHMNKIEYYLS